MRKSLFYLLSTVFMVMRLAAQPQAGVDIQHYTFKLTLINTDNRISGKTDVVVRFTEAGLKELRLDLVGQAPAETGMVVKEVLSSGKQVTFTHTDNIVRIPLAVPSDKNEERTFSITYSGIPADGLIISKNKFGDRTFFGDNWPNRARHWLPVVDHPSDKATCEFIVTAPTYYQVVGNGLLREETNLPDEQRLTHWKESIPIPTKVMVIGASRFAVQYVDTVRNVPVQSWVYPQEREAGLFDYAPAAQILAFMDSLIGPYPYEKLANVQSKTRFGGMENASNIFYNEERIYGKKNLEMERLLAHEIAHQWFGNSVTEKDWSHIWLSEGFATYLADVYVERAYGARQMADYMQKERQQVFDYARKAAAAPIVMPQPPDLMSLLNANSYQKGAWVLHMLRHTVGEKAFWLALRKYYGQYRNQNAATQDFQKVMESVSGKDLSSFFKQWLYTPGYPRLTGTWTYDEKQKEVVVQLRQEQTGSFTFSLEIGVYDNADKLLVKETLLISQNEKTFRLRVNSRPVNLVADPDTKVLAEVTIQKK